MDLFKKFFLKRLQCVAPASTQEELDWESDLISTASQADGTTHLEPPEPQFSHPFSGHTAVFLEGYYELVILLAPCLLCSGEEAEGGRGPVMGVMILIHFLEETSRSLFWKSQGSHNDLGKSFSSV